MVSGSHFFPKAPLLWTKRIPAALVTSSKRIGRRGIDFCCWPLRTVPSAVALSKAPNIGNKLRWLKWRISRRPFRFGACGHLGLLLSLAPKFSFRLRTLDFPPRTPRCARESAAARDYPRDGSGGKGR